MQHTFAELFIVVENVGRKEMQPLTNVLFAHFSALMTKFMLMLELFIASHLPVLLRTETGNLFRRIY